MATGSAGGAATATKAAVTGQEHVVTGFEVAVLTADVTDQLTIEVRHGSTVMWKTAIAAAETKGHRVGKNFVAEIRAPLSTAVSVVAGAPGGTTVLVVNMEGYTI